MVEKSLNDTRNFARFEEILIYEKIMVLLKNNGDFEVRCLHFFYFAFSP